VKIGSRYDVVMIMPTTGSEGSDELEGELDAEGEGASNQI
jgi:hypothetical protein